MTVSHCLRAGSEWDIFAARFFFLRANITVNGAGSLVVAAANAAPSAAAQLTIYWHGRWLLVRITQCDIKTSVSMWKSVRFRGNVQMWLTVATVSEGATTKWRITGAWAVRRCLPCTMLAELCSLSYWFGWLPWETSIVMSSLKLAVFPFVPLCYRCYPTLTLARR